MVKTDLRSLALMRITVALVLLYDLFDRSFNLWAHYGVEGVIPIAALSRHHLTVHLLGGDAGLVVVFILHALAAVALLVGFYTPVTSVAVWLLTLSLQHRNPYVLYGGDQLLILALMWGCFLPWGRRFSYDARRLEPVADGYRSLGGTMVVGQLVLLYLETAWLKSGNQWTQEGNAVYHALTAFLYERPLGQALREAILQWPLLDQILTFGTLAWEYLVGLLLLTPLRDLAALSMVLFHLGIWLTLMVGFFPMISSALACGALTEKFWKRVAADSDSAGDEAVVEPVWIKVVLIVLALLSLLSVAINLGWVQKSTRADHFARKALRLDQSWNMFAPKAPTDTGWYCARGRTAQGQEVELLLVDRQFYSEERPANVPSAHGGMRWGTFCFKFFPRRRRNELAPMLVDFLKRRWQKKNPGQTLVQVDLIYHRGRVRAYLDVTTRERVVYSERFYR